MIDVRLLGCCKFTQLNPKNSHLYFVKTKANPTYISCFVSIKNCTFLRRFFVMLFSRSKAPYTSFADKSYKGTKVITLFESCKFWSLLFSFFYALLLFLAT